MNVLSLFDGMSCGRLALERIGVKPITYYASEIDRYAIKVSQSNYPDIIQLGDIENWEQWDIDWSSIDLLIGGSPCQGFSRSGSHLNFDDPRSRLFFVYVDILNHVEKHNPQVKFLLENVKMSKASIDIISDELGVEPMFINSEIVTAQNRQRLYWFNWNADLPNRIAIWLEDIIDSGYVDRQKSYCIDANYAKGGDLNQYFNKSRRQLVFSEPVTCYEDAIDVEYRKLTPVECERLQGVPVGYTDHVSATQRYKMLGNGWTVPVISHLFEEMMR